MKRSEAVHHFGSISALAKALDISYEAVRQWSEEGIPLLRQYQLQEITAGQLLVDGSSASDSAVQAA
ncbi:MAG: Cro/CI family transcriptional regulator [Pseudomonadota bacterium]|nr:Cro/CI family transcriptional regulator [Pseudomonadota bacterium]